jgi:DNA-binding NtrC family response regulator
VDSSLKRLGSSLSVSPAALDCLGSYPFPGNVRELRNVIERAVLMCDGDTILPEHLPDKFCRSNGSDKDPGRSADIRSLADIENDHIRAALRQHRGSRASLAQRLGISERALYRKIAQLKRS